MRKSANSSYLSVEHTESARGDNLIGGFELRHNKEL